MNRTRIDASCAVACGAFAVLAASAGADDRAFVAAVNRYLPALRTAEQATASSHGAPDLVQREYDLARNFEEALNVAGATSRSCRPLANATRELARAWVRHTEGYDLRDAGVLLQATRRIATLTARYTVARKNCRGGGSAVAKQVPALESPIPGHVFFRSVDVRGRAPVRARWAVVTVDSQPRSCKRGRSVRKITHGRLSASFALPPGRHDLAVTFCAGSKSKPVRVASVSTNAVWLLSAAEASAAAPRSESAALDARLAGAASGFAGISAVWYHDVRTGTTAAWNADAVFPAASTVKLGLLVAALNRFGVRSPVSYDLEAMTTWSSNLAANRLLDKVGGATAAQSALARAGATHSTFTGAYRVGTAFNGVATDPPRISARVTTARDLGAILYTLHAAAVGRPNALVRLRLSRSEARLALGLLLSSRAQGDNVGLFRPALGTTPAAQKHGWLSSARHTAAIVYTPSGPKILVLLTYAPNLTLRTAQAYGGRLIDLLDVV